MNDDTSAYLIYAIILYLLAILILAVFAIPLRWEYAFITAKGSSLDAWTTAWNAILGS